MKWSVPLWLVRVVEPIPLSAVAVTGTTGDEPREVEQTKAYLASVSAGLSGDVRAQCLRGRVVPELVSFACQQLISHVVMASHGRTALSRVILGSVADDLIHKLKCGIVVIPALAAGRIEEHPPGKESHHLVSTR